MIRSRSSGDRLPREKHEREGVKWQHVRTERTIIDTVDEAIEGERKCEMDNTPPIIFQFEAGESFL